MLLTSLLHATMNREKLQVLGFFLMDVTGNQNALSTIDDGWKKTVGFYLLI